MLETITLITLATLFLIFFRPGKTPPLENPLVINRGGQFHAVLAPKLNLAQPLLENIARHFVAEDRHAGNTHPRYYRVSDRDVKAHGKDYFLLAVTLRDGVMYFQVAAPEPDADDLDTIRNCAEAELSHHPENAEHSEAAEIALDNAIQAATSQRGSSFAPMVKC